MYSIITAKRKKKKAVNFNSDTIKSTGPGQPKGKKKKSGHVKEVTERALNT
jgi:hypothetical protein